MKWKSEVDQQGNGNVLSQKIEHKMHRGGRLKNSKTEQPINHINSTTIKSRQIRLETEISKFKKNQEFLEHYGSVFDQKFDHNN